MDKLNKRSFRVHQDQVYPQRSSITDADEIRDMEAVRDGSVQNVDLSIWIPYLTPSGPPSPVFPSKNTGKTKRQLHDRKTEQCKALAENDKTSAIADHVETTKITDILAKGKTDYHCLVSNREGLGTSM